MNALPLMIAALCVLAIAYRYYSAFIAAKIMAFDDSRPTPAHTMYDGQNYYPTNKWVLFGHHFAAIAGAGPLIGPVLAMQFGFLPGFLWVLIGVVLAGAVQDFIILFASVRRGAKSLVEIARTEINSVAGFTAAIAVLFIVIIAMAGMGVAVVNALRESSWGTFTIGMTIPIAVVMGFYMFRYRRGSIRGGTIFGLIGLTLAVVGGRYIPDSWLAPYFTFDKNQLTFLLAAYGFLASVLPVWLLLSPRDYLSSTMKIGVVGFLVLGVLIVHPDLKMPAFSQFTSGGGPIIPGKVFPFVFITIACGAISGFHSLVSSGTTPKMIEKESHIRPIGYGCMLIEGLVGITSLIAAAALYPGDYFHINADASKFAWLHSLGLDPVNLNELSQGVGENVVGRTGGAVSLAVGMAQIFSNIPGLRGLMSYWYHFAIMFEALFILTVIDAGTRIGRFILQELIGKVYKPFERTNWLPGNIVASLVVVFAWGYFLYAGSISTIWPMFGIANQLLAAVALSVGTTVIINMGKARYCWVTLVPTAWVTMTTLTAGWMSITDNFLGPLVKANPFQGYLNTVLTALMMSCVIIILINSLLKWKQVLLPGRATLRMAEMGD